MFNNRRSVRRTAMITAVSALLVFTTAGCDLADYIYDMTHPCHDNPGCVLQPSSTTGG